MSGWLPLIAAFWLLYLLHGLARGRHGSSGWQRGLFGTWGPMDGALRLGGLLPTDEAWVAWELPLALAPEGVSNRAPGCSLRPASMPAVVRAWTWESIREVADRGGRLWINGKAAGPSTPLLTAEELLRLRDSCLANPAAEARAAVLRGWMDRRFSATRAARLRRIVLGRTRLASWLGWGVLGLDAALSAFFGGAFGEDLSPGQIRFLVPAIALALPAALLLHAALLVAGWRAAARLLRGRRADRIEFLVTMALQPPLALRLRPALSSLWPRPLHPVAAVAANLPTWRLKRLLDLALRDAHWPAVPPGGLESAATRISAWHGAETAVRLEGIARSRGIDPASLLAPPLPEPGVCAYCPRCGDTFVQNSGRCPQGVALLPLGRRPD